MHYSLQKKSYIQTYDINFKLPKQGPSFVTCSLATGLGLGTIYEMKKPQKLNNRLFVALVPHYYARRLYNNFIKDRERVYQLALEYEKTNNAASNYSQNYPIFDTQTFVNENQEAGVTQGKRKSLNNGIFKANDNYS